MLTNIILWIIFGGLVGWLASIVVRTDAEQGAIANIIVGIIGAFVGGFIARLFGGSGVTGFNLSSFLVAMLGAVVLLLAYKALMGSRYRTRG